MPAYAYQEIHTSEDIRAVADNAGSYFFSRDTMRFFDSRLLSGVVALDGHKAADGARFLFVTSERYSTATARFYVLRMATLTSVRDDRPGISFDTLSRYSTPHAAKAAAQTYAYLEV